MRKHGFARRMATIIVLGALSSHAFVSSHEDVEGFGYIGGGMAWLDLATVNSALDVFGVPDFSERPVLVSFGMHTLVQHLTAETELQGLHWRSQSASGTEADLWGGTALVNLGLDLAGPGSVWQLYPYAGAGIGIWKIAVHAEAMPFAQALSTPPPPAPVWLPTFVLDFGGGLVRTFAAPNRRSHYVIGVKGGYLYDPTRSSTWNMEGVDVTGGPAPLMSGPYVKVIIGKGYRLAGADADLRY